MPINRMELNLSLCGRSKESKIESPPKPEIIILTGESGSGKTTLLNEIIAQQPEQFKKIVTYTSRPIREGEIDGIDYHFKDDAFFKDNPDLELVKKSDEGYFYATAKSDLDKSSGKYLLGTFRAVGINKLIALGYTVRHIHIDIDQELKISRMRERGDSEEDIEKRLESDQIYITEIQEIITGNTVSTTIIEAASSLEEKVDIVRKSLID